MAKRYSGAKGKSGSHKPDEKTIPSWLRYKGKEVELLIVKLSKEGYTPSQIGMHLRDTYGVPDVKLITNKKLNEILDEKKLSQEIPEDLLAVIKKSVNLTKHLEENHKDFTAKRGLQLTDSRIKRLVDYYKKSGKLPANFKYDRESIKLYVQ